MQQYFEFGMHITERLNFTNDDNVTMLLESTIVMVVTVVRVRAAGVFVNFAVYFQLLAQ